MQYATHLSLHFCPTNLSSVFFFPRNLIALHSENLFMLIFRDWVFPRKKCYTACSVNHQCCTLLYRVFHESPVLYFAIPRVPWITSVLHCYTACSVNHKCCTFGSVLHLFHGDILWITDCSVGIAQYCPQTIQWALLSSPQTIQWT
jgi:hypothetical protein